MNQKTLILAAIKKRGVKKGEMVMIQHLFTELAPIESALGPGFEEALDELIVEGILSRLKTRGLFKLEVDLP
jgi:hypothetical protein